MKQIQTVIGLIMAWVLITPAVFAQANTAPDQQEKAMHYSLYYEDFKNENFDSALPNLRWILKNAPLFPRKNDRNFERAVKTYQEIGLAQTEPDLRRAYLDSALIMFDTAVPTIMDGGGEIDEYEWTFKKGKFIHDNTENLGDLVPMIGELYMSAFDMDPARLQPYYVNYLIADYVQNDDKEGALTFMERVETELAGNAEYEQMIATWRNSLFTSPEDRFEFIAEQLDKDPDNAELIQEKFELAMELEYRDEVYALSDRVLELEPSPRTYRLVAKMRLDDGQAEDALGLYEEALTMEGAGEFARDIYYNMGIAEQQIGRLSKARTDFRKALDIDPGFGPALMAIGDLYVTAVANCGSFEREDRAVYWLVTDYYARARSRDESVSSAADRKIRQYRAYYPDQEALFFKGWKTGESYPINYSCYSWIGETTTIKSP